MIVFSTILPPNDSTTATAPSIKTDLSGYVPALVYLTDIQDEEEEEEEERSVTPPPARENNKRKKMNTESEPPRGKTIRAPTNKRGKHGAAEQAALQEQEEEEEEAEFE